MPDMKKTIRLSKEQKEFLTCKTSRLIEIAVDDLRKCEKSKKYIISMSDWIDNGIGKEGEVCYVCLAGAALAQTMKVKYFSGYEEDLIDPLNGYAREATYRARSLNRIRQGILTDIYTSDELDEQLRKIENRYNVIDYHDDPKKFKRQMLGISKALAKIGL